MLSRDAAGRIMVVIAVLGLIVALIGTVIAWQLVADLDRGVGQSLEITGEVLVTVDESFIIAEDALEILDEGVVEAEAAVRALSRSMSEGQGALESATALTGGDVADALESVERSLPSIQAAADTIDETLRALSNLPFPLAYDPDEPLGETIGELREELRELPDELREQAAQVERTTEELAAATEGTEATADSLAELQTRLADASALISQYAASTGDARSLIEDQRDVLATSTTRARFMLVAFGLVFALSQFVPLYLGLGMLGVGGIVADRVVTEETVRPRSRSRSGP